MTNEQLAAFIKQGGNDELIPILWERIRKIMYIKSDKIYCALESRFVRCGVDIWDLKQSCYMAFLKAVEGYKPDGKSKFTSYLSYPFKNVVRELTGVRIQKNEPLNNCTSLDVPLKDDEKEITLADTIADESAINAPEQTELEDDYRILHEAVDNLKEPMNRVINAYYFEDKSFTQIGKEMGISHSTVSSIKAKAMRCLRRSQPLLQLYREEMQHEALNSMQRYQTRPDMHLYITELEEKYRQMLNKNTA